MKREKRRVLLAQRQHMIATIGQRNAMRALADTLGEEERSAALALRSRDLAREYATRNDGGGAEALSQSGRFAAALGGLANDAEQARDDAAQQASWQAKALGAAQVRTQRHEERLANARAGLSAALERLETERLGAASKTRSAKLARDLHSDEADTSAAPKARSQRKTG